MKFYFLGYTYQETHWQGENDGNVEGGRGEASDRRDNSVDGSSTGEGAPVEED